MTLILTCMTPSWVAQVSDCRLSYGRSGVAPRDTARKILFYVGHGARLTIAYTGLAEFRVPGQPGTPLEIWLADTIPDLAATAVSVPQLAGLLMSKLDDATQNTRRTSPNVDTRLSIIMAGFIAPTAPPGAVVLSNFEVGGHRLPMNPDIPALPVVAPSIVEASVGSFQYSHVRKSQGLGILIHGDHTTLSPPHSIDLRNAIRGVEDPEIARAAMVRAMKSIARGSPGSTVSADCWSWIVRKDENFQHFQPHFDQASKQSLSPSLIGPHQRIDSLLVSTAESPDVGLIRAKLNRGLLSERIDSVALRAYLEWAPCIKRLASEFEDAGIGMSKPAYVGDLLTLIHQSGHLFIDTLDKHLESAFPWVMGMARVRTEEIKLAAQGRPVVVDVEYLVAMVLISLRPDRYSTDPPPGAFSWMVTEKLKLLARQHNPALQ
jgi:hypothetical protein